MAVSSSRSLVYKTIGIAILLWWMFPIFIISWTHPSRAFIPSFSRCRRQKYIKGTPCRNKTNRSSSHVQLSLTNPEPSALAPEKMDRNGKPVDAAPIPDGALIPSISNTQQQLWLDLRGTALFPKEALLFLQEQCLSGVKVDKTNAILCKFVSAVLVSTEQMDAILASNHHQEDDASGFYEDDYQLLYTTENGNDLILHAPATQQSVKVGCIVSGRPERWDILATHDAVLQQRQWILLQDASNNSSSSSMSQWMIKQITEVLQFLFTSDAGIASEDFAMSASGLLLPDTTRLSNPSTDLAQELDLPGGGVAMACRDRATLFQMDALVAEYRHSAAGTSTTGSGLSIPKPDDDAGAGPSFGTALLLPLDVSLWETALQMRASPE